MEKTKISVKKIIGLVFMGLALIVVVMIIANWEPISQAFMIGYAETQ